jgi:hypothetical protein
MDAMSTSKRYFRVENARETTAKAVPPITPVVRIAPLEPAGYPVNMIYATAEDMSVFRPEQSDDEPKE